ncbi:class I ribonucleotide reductase maintenance protein YfaE [Alteromonas facilis]|uniref:class I ribonucleotide reductase maintenance protein YfaE n=1 Tax=Alteromonas facilis TaxID=2048004 RepID=UPI000C284DC6
MPFCVTVIDGKYDNGDTQTLNPAPKETLLETLERYQIDVQFHCRDGFCGACRCKIKSGTVAYTTDPLAFIDDDEILPCCTKATSDLTLLVN